MALWLLVIAIKIVFEFGLVLLPLSRVVLQVRVLLLQSSCQRPAC